MHYTPLSQRGLLAISGEEAIPFLQGIVSNDVTRLEKGHAVYAALLSPQGKYLHDFFLVRHGISIFIDAEKARLDDLQKRLKLYKLRAKVNIDALPDSMGVIAAWGGKQVTMPEIAVFTDPRLPKLGWRLLGDMAEMDTFCRAQNFSKAPFEDYDRMRLTLGVPDGSRDMIVDKSLLLQCHFEALHGVDFTKGCYIGQEVTARSKHRGQVRKFLYQVKAEGTLPEPGTPVYSGEALAGEMRSRAGDIGLALLKSELAQNLQADAKPLIANMPRWAKTGEPQ